MDVGATLATEVGFATTGQVKQQVRPRDTLPLGLYRYPVYQDPFDRYGAGRVVGRWEAVAVGASGVSRQMVSPVQPLLNDEGLQWWAAQVIET